MSKKLTKEQLNEAKRSSISYEGELESFCISLLIEHDVKFLISKPRKTVNKERRFTDSLFCDIKEIEIGNKRYDFYQIISKEIDYANNQNLQSINESNRLKQIKLRKHNLISSTNNFLCELIENLGYYILYKNKRITKKLLQMKRVISIQGDDIKVLHLQEIKEIGSKVNKLILNKFEELKLIYLLYFQYF